MLRNRSLKLSFIKDHGNDKELNVPAVDPKEIEEIARRSVLDLTKLGVAAIGSLMILHTSLKIIEDKATKD